MLLNNFEDQNLTFASFSGSSLLRHRWMSLRTDGAPTSNKYLSLNQLDIRKVGLY